jgi:hypothetical protein
MFETVIYSVTEMINTKIMNALVSIKHISYNSLQRFMPDSTAGAVVDKANLQIHCSKYWRHPNHSKVQ